MANPERGEVEIVVDDRPYTLKLSTNVAVTFERKEKKTIGQLATEMAAMKFESIRYFAWLLLQRHHKDEFKTQEQVGDLIDDFGGVVQFVAKVNELFAVNQPTAEDSKAGTADPRTAQANGTGDGSIASPGASV